MDLDLLLALLSGGLVGLLLGATGGGGSLVAIPLLVYVVGIPVQKASAMSLIVVGIFRSFWRMAGKPAETSPYPCCHRVQLDRSIWGLDWRTRSSTGL